MHQDTLERYFGPMSIETSNRSCGVAGPERAKRTWPRSLARGHAPVGRSGPATRRFQQSVTKRRERGARELRLVKPQLFVFLLQLLPGVAEGDGAVEDELLGRGIDRVDTEVTLSLELKTATRFGGGQ